MQVILPMGAAIKPGILIIENKTGEGAVLKKIVRTAALPLKKISIISFHRFFSDKELKQAALYFVFLPGNQKNKTAALLSLLRQENNSPVIIITEKYNVSTLKKWIQAGAAEVLPAAGLNTLLLEKTLRYALQTSSISNELKWSEERYQLVGKATRDMVWDWDFVKNRVFRSKEGWGNISGNPDSNDNNHPDSWWNRIHPQDKKMVTQTVQHILKNKELSNFEFGCRIIRDDGTISHIIDKGYAIRNEKGEVTRLVGITRDITARLELEKTLEYERKKKQDEITAAVIAAQEKERDAIGKELHDNINQVLATTRLYIEYAMANPDMRDGYLENAQKFILSAVEEIRRLSRSLMPPSLGQVGLAMALSDLTESISVLKKFKIHTDCRLLDESKLNDDLRLTIFRIVQEQLTNIIKHADAKNVKIKIKTLKKRLLLEVEDDGRGFNKKQVNAGLGFKNISSRAQLHKGRLQLVTAKNKGCRIRLEFDL